jgi:hypothetical protein
MEKDALDYGFKTFPDREQAVSLIADRDNFDSAMALDEITSTDYDYGFPYADRGKLKKLDRKGLGKSIAESSGFIEKAPGYTRKPDIYATPEGAARASQFIREEILPQYEDLSDDTEGALKNELKYTDRINRTRELYNIKKSNLEQNIESADLNYGASRGAGFYDRIRGDAQKLLRTADKGRLALNDAVYRNKIDYYKKKIADVPEDVMYSRFADAIDRSLLDHNELYDFRYY